MKKFIKFLILIDIVLIVTIICCFVLIKNTEQKRDNLIQKNNSLISEFIEHNKIEIEERIEEEKKKNIEKEINYMFSSWSTKKEIAIIIMADKAKKEQKEYVFYNEIVNNEYKIKELDRKINKIEGIGKILSLHTIILSCFVLFVFTFKYIRKFLIYIISYVIVLFNYIADGITSFILDIDKQVNKKETSSLNEIKIKKIVKIFLIIIFIILICLIFYYLLHNPHPRNRARLSWY